MRSLLKLRSDTAFALIVSAAFVAVALAISTGVQFVFPLHGWLYADDFFAQLRDAHTILWGGYGIFYSPGIGQTPHPFGALSLTPLAELSTLMNYIEPYPYPLPRPTIWLWGVGYMGIYLFAYVMGALRLYRRLPLKISLRRWAVGASALLAAFCLFPWGHPEDVAAMALSCFAFADLLDTKRTRAAYLAGAAVAFQPLTLLFLMPLALLEIKGLKRLGSFVVRSAIIPLAVALPAMAGNFSASLSAVLSEPQSAKLRFNRPTLWDLLLNIHHDQISTGWFRVAMLLIALGVGIALRIAWRKKKVDPLTVLVVCVVGVSLRAFLEPTQVAYYLAPYLAFGAIAIVPVVKKPRLFALFWSAFGLAQLAAAQTTLSALSYSLLVWPLALAGVLAILMALPERGAESEVEAEPQDARVQEAPERFELGGQALEEVTG